MLKSNLTFKQIEYFIRVAYKQIDYFNPILKKLDDVPDYEIRDQEVDDLKENYIIYIHAFNKVDPV